MQSVAKRIRQRLCCLLLALTLTLSAFSLPLCAPAAAAAKQVVKLATPKFTGVSISENKATLKWSKIKGAKTYRFYRVTSTNYWKYWKTVKKNKANQKKFADKNKYYLKVSGKNYRVYTKAKKYVYTRLRTLSACSYTFKGDYNKNYSFCVKAVNGNKVSKLSAFKTVQTGKKKPVVKVKRSINYELNGGEWQTQAPRFYYEGDGFSTAVPVKENRDFEGWFTDAALTVPLAANTKTLRGDLTLYAKWHLAALNENGNGLEDMIWSWWYYPQAVSVPAESGAVQALFWGFATKDGHCGVAQYNAADGSVTKTALKLAGADDHNGLALTLLEDKRIMAAYAGGHNTDNEIHIRLSDKPLDIRSFSTDVVLYSRGKTCYSQILKSGESYYLFYRVNNHSWAYRSTKDCIHWSEEVILVKASMQYYCRFQKTSEDSIFRVLMYANPSEKATEIRMGYFCTEDNSIYDGSGYAQGFKGKGVLQGKLPASDNSYTAFTVLLEKPETKTQRLFDCAVTAPECPRFLYARFSMKKNVNDSIYYLYDSGNSYAVVAGGKALMDYKYQLGACFVTAQTIAAAHNENGADLVELFAFDGSAVSLQKNITTGVGAALSRNARPIADVNGKALLWHSGYYNDTKYTDFDTNANLYFPENERLVQTGETAGSVTTQVRGEGFPNAENAALVRAYAERLYEENRLEIYRTAQFTWSQEQHKRGWLYYNGLVLEAFLMMDDERYSPEIIRFYDQHIVKNPAAGGSFDNTAATIPTEYKIWQYVAGELDWALPAVGMVDLLVAGKAAGDSRNPDREAQYASAINYVYNQLELQTCYEACGSLLQHSEREQNGARVPTSSWSRWNICLDGVYMSNLFLIHVAQAIDAGKISITSLDGSTVQSSAIWEVVYERLDWVMEHMRNAKTGLLYHGYSVGDACTNGVSWSRGIGWFAMVLEEAAESMPHAEQRATLQRHFADLMSAAVAWQDARTGLWYNVPDRREEVDKNMPETSGSAMLSYCLLRGYRAGILKSEVYQFAGQNAFHTLVQTRLSAEGLADTLIGSGVTDNPDRYQVNRFVTNEAKGIAPLIMAEVFIRLQADKY